MLEQENAGAPNRRVVLKNRVLDNPLTSNNTTTAPALRAAFADVRNKNDANADKKSENDAKPEHNLRSRRIATARQVLAGGDVSRNDGPGQSNKPAFMPKPDIRKPLRSTARNFIAENREKVAGSRGTSGIKPPSGAVAALARSQSQQFGPSTAAAALPSKIHRTSTVVGAVSTTRSQIHRAAVAAHASLSSTAAAAGQAQAIGSDKKVSESGDHEIKEDKGVSSNVTQEMPSASEVDLSVDEAEDDVHMESQAEIKEDDLSYDNSILDAFSAEAVAMLPNIDEDDEGDPLMVADYVNDIYAYLRKLERSMPVEEDYLKGKLVTSKMRAVLVNWLIEVQMKFELLPETLYMTVALLDRFLQTHDIPKTQLQLAGVTCMFLASKYEEIYAPEIRDFEFISDHSCSPEAIRDMEITILVQSGFKLGVPLSIHFLRRFSKAADATSELHTMSKYLCEVSLVDYALAHVPPSQIAAAASFISLKLLRGDEGTWDDVMLFYSHYTEAQLQDTVKRLVHAVIRISKSEYRFRAAFNKFKTKQFMQIALSPKFSHANLTKLFLQE